MKIDSYLLVLICYIIFSAVVSGMPVPDKNSSLYYKWAFHTLTILSSNLSYVVSHFKNPGGKYEKVVDSVGGDSTSSIPMQPKQ